MIQNWLLDFDGTLATGSVTWGITGAFPKLAREHQLEWDEARFASAMLVAQERGSHSMDPMVVLNEVFDSLGWDRALQKPFMADLQSNYRPEVYEDTLTFLKYLQDNKCSVYVVSNNSYTYKSVQNFGFAPYVVDVFTPARCPGCQPKPHRSLWDYLVERYADLQAYNTAIIGDNPYSDGAFAQACGLPCYIIDRLGRFTTLYETHPYHWIRSLRDLMPNSN